MNRTILHIDMNAFFASVEQQANPELRGKAIAVTGGGHRTVITTSSYEARAKGVKTGMAVWEAKRCCPELIIVVGDNRKYTYTSKEIMRMMLDYTPEVEVFSIDEAFMDVTHSLSLFGTPEEIARQLKARIRQRFGITCSIGIAPNKLLAKLASDMQKPDGLTVVRPGEIARIMERLPVKDLCGIGRKTEQQLALMSIRTCGELGRCDEDRLIRRFGIVGPRLKLMGQGRDDAPVIPHGEDDEVKSVGHSTTLDKDIERREDILAVLLRLSEMVGRRARRYSVSGRTVSLYIRYADFFTSFGKQQTQTNYVNLSEDIFKAAVDLLDSVELEQPVRLLGVTLSNLQHQAEQLPLFEAERRRIFATQAMDEVNSRFGDFTVTFATLLPGRERNGSFVIAPAWRPDGIKNINCT
jgi:DNA polymerase-4